MRIGREPRCARLDGRMRPSLRNPGTSEGGRLSTSQLLRLADVGAVLEVVLENLCGQGGGHTLSMGFDGADHFSATDNFGGRKTGNFWRQHEANLQLCVRMEKFLRLEQQSGAADVLRGAGAPALFTERTIAQRKLEIETASSERGNPLFKNACAAGLHSDLQGDGLGIQHLADTVFQNGKAERFLE